MSAGNDIVECKGCLSFVDDRYCAHKLDHYNCPCKECLVKPMCYRECLKFAMCLVMRDDVGYKEAEIIYNGR